VQFLATLEISPYISSVFLFKKIREVGRIGSAKRWGRVGGWMLVQTMYIHVSKCKNDKMRKKKKLLNTKKKSKVKK
jgi:hypothetical protein